MSLSLDCKVQGGAWQVGLGTWAALRPGGGVSRKPLGGDWIVGVRASASPPPIPLRALSGHTGALSLVHAILLFLLLLPVCHQGPDHGGPGSDLNHRQHPHPTQRLPPQEGTEAVRARNPAPAPNIKSCLQLGLVGSALSKLSRQGLLKPLDSKEELHFLTRWPLLVPLTGEQCGQN